MKGLELARTYYEEYGAKMIRESFPELESIIAVGLVGEGSECFGYDDEISRDHDFEPGFCMFIPDGDTIDSRTEFRLERAYAALPKEFMGVKRQRLSPVGGNRRGVIRTGDFYKKLLGSPCGPQTSAEWFSLPEHFLATAVNGEVFRDDLGGFSSVRERISFYPRDVFLKKLAGDLLLMAQAGQYNYSRCIAHAEPAAAQLAVYEFASRAMRAAFLLNGRYMPYYKWSFRALRELEKFAGLAETLEFLITSDNSPDMAEIKSAAIEDTAGAFIEELQLRGLTEAVCGDLEKHAYSVNDRISDPSVRNANVLAAV